MKTQKRQKLYRVILLLTLAAYIVKNLFVGMDIDEGYGVVAGYRLAMGDRLLLEMWEPHQTSAIFTALLEKPWLVLVGTDFLDLYLKVVYFVIHGLITWFIYRTLRKCIRGMDGKAAFLMAAVFFVTSPKSIFIPEYSNLHQWFFMLLMMTLLRYYASPGGRRAVWLILAGFSLTGDVLAYPSMALLYVLCILLIVRMGSPRAEHKNRSRWSEILLFTMPCFLSLCVFMGYLLSYLNVEQIKELIPYILADGSHQTTLQSKLSDIVLKLGIMALVMAADWLVSYTVGKPLARFLHKKKFPEEDPELFQTAVITALFGLIQLVIQLMVIFFSRYNACYSMMTFVGLCLTGLWFYRKGGKPVRAGYCLVLFSLASYLCVILLSNWGIMLLNVYLVGGAIGGLLCMYCYFRDRMAETGRRLVCAAAFGLVMVHAFGYCWLCIGCEDSHSPIYTLGGYGHGGVRAGIITSWMSAYRYNTNLDIWSEAVPDGSTVLYAGSSQYFCMLGDCTIASPNTISTPVYDENLLKYWEINPDRYPDVVAVESWFGDTPYYDEDSFIMQWLENDYGYTRKVEYSYITVYYKD